MRRAKQTAAALAERLCRPQRIGIFGHRGVGKTTLLTMLYREAVGGRLPGLRLAAADARTADYLSDKILQLESGQPLPATLAETELRFHLYHHGARFELLVKDYQGEHVELGRKEPIRDFLRDCDAVWLCLDAATARSADDRLRREQEVEQLVEDYLAHEQQPTVPRPTALVLTKADLIEESAAGGGQWGEHLGMTRHALHTHCPHSDLFAVSSLGRAKQREKAKGDRSPETVACRRADVAVSPVSPSAFALSPLNLAEPLAWLARALQAQDEARLERLWSLAGNDVRLLERGVACFARRYPEAAATAAYRQRLLGLRRRRVRRRSLLTAAGIACLLSAVCAYDALGYQRAARFETEHAGDPAAILNEWQSYQTWHPTRNLLRPASAHTEERRLYDLRLAELRCRSNDPDADPETAWRQFGHFRAAYPSVSGADDFQGLRATLKARRDEQIRRRAEDAYDRLVRAEHDGDGLALLLGQTDQFLRDFPQSARGGEVRRRREAYLRRLDERDIEAARNYSTRQPLNFQTRRENYQRYLDQHPNGVFAAEAAAALRAIENDGDKHDFRAVRDHFMDRPGDIPELVARCRAYLAAHPQGRFGAAATDLLRWSERVTAPGEYRVVLRNGQFDKQVAHFFSRGPDLSVELEVAGVRYGPSNIVVNRYDPEWNYEFPRRIRWKRGDPVRIRVTDHDYWPRVVIDLSSADGDPLALTLLTGDAWCGKNRLTFESDFSLPTLPKIE